MIDQIRIIETFASVQGETSFAGLPTFFIRLAACNLRCSWCDTTYSFGRGTATPISTLVEETLASGCRHVCITGGEPLLQTAVHTLMARLADQGLVLSIETGGSLPIAEIDPRVTTILDIKCPGSGMHETTLFANFEHLKPQDEIKFVILDEKDYHYAVDIANRYNLFRYEVLLSPVHGVLDSQTLVGWILRDKLPVRLNLQIHKFIWEPATRGV